MTADLMSRLEQLQQELDAAQQIANNNYRLYTQVKEQRDELLLSLKECYLVLENKSTPEITRLHVMSLALEAITKAEGR